MESKGCMCAECRYAQKTENAVNTNCNVDLKRALCAFDL